MQIIAELEGGPRGVYTGTIGWAGPDGPRYSWPSAPRSPIVSGAGWAYGVGSGIAGRLPRRRRIRRMPAQGPHPRGGAVRACSRRSRSCRRRATVRLEGHLATAAAKRPPTSADARRGRGLGRALEDGRTRPPAPTRVRLLVDLFGRARLELIAPRADRGTASCASDWPGGRSTSGALAAAQDHASRGLRGRPPLPSGLRRCARSPTRGERSRKGRCATWPWSDRAARS